APTTPGPAAALAGGGASGVPVVGVVAVVLAVATVAAVVLGVAPQLVLDLAGR
ncbi:NADH-quinone oxidoreductase subunit N, partial [Micromonospora sp. PSH25]|nr:NADH-quinone oxidoreductase subunit N [Micromonospora foliorum]